MSVTTTIDHLEDSQMKTLSKTEQTKKISHWDSLTHLLEQADEKTIETLKDKFHKKELCINGFANGVYPVKKKVTESDFMFKHLLEQIGFSKEEIRKERNCVVNGCPYHVAGLGLLFNHFIGYHKIPIRNIARLITPIKNDTRPIEKGWTGAKKIFQSSHMGTD